MKHLLIILLFSSCAVRKQATVTNHLYNSVLLVTDEGDTICWRARYRPEIGQRYWAYFAAHKITKIRKIK